MPGLPNAVSDFLVDSSLLRFSQAQTADCWKVWDHTIFQIVISPAHAFYQRIGDIHAVDQGYSVSVR